MAARRGRAEAGVRVSARTLRELRVVRTASGAGGGRGGGCGGRGAGGPSPCPAAGGRPEPREFPRPGGRCGRCSGSLQVTRGAAPAGLSGAEHAAERAELGAESPLLPRPRLHWPARAQQRRCWRSWLRDRSRRPVPRSLRKRAPGALI